MLLKLRTNKISEYLSEIAINLQILNQNKLCCQNKNIKILNDKIKNIKSSK